MTRTGWTLLISTLVSLGSSISAGAQPLNSQTRASRPTLNLDLQNVAEVSTAVLAEAKETLTRIYQAAGIRVEWNTTGAGFTVILRRPPHPDAVRDSVFALGYAPGAKGERGHLAFVLADRVESTASGLGVPFHLVLGMTMAHEVAHLLLPYNSHSRDGIMRNDWTQSDYQKARLGYLFFTDGQAKLMRDAPAATHRGSPLSMRPQP